MDFTYLASERFYFKLEYINLTKQKIEKTENQFGVKLNLNEFTLDFFEDFGPHGNERKDNGKFQ